MEGKKEEKEEIGEIHKVLYLLKEKKGMPMDEMEELFKMNKRTIYRRIEKAKHLLSTIPT